MRFTFHKFSRFSEKEITAEFYFASISKDVENVAEMTYRTTKNYISSVIVRWFCCEDFPSQNSSNEILMNFVSDSKNFFHFIVRQNLTVTKEKSLFPAILLRWLINHPTPQSTRLSVAITRGYWGRKWRDKGNDCFPFSRNNGEDESLENVSFLSMASSLANHLSWGVFGYSHEPLTVKIIPLSLRNWGVRGKGNHNSVCDNFKKFDI